MKGSLVKRLNIWILKRRNRIIRIIFIHQFKLMEAIFFTSGWYWIIIASKWIWMLSSKDLFISQQADAHVWKMARKKNLLSSSRVRINDVMNLICSLGSNLTEWIVGATVEIKWKATFSSYIIDQTLISSMSKGIWFDLVEIKIEQISRSIFTHYSYLLR